MVSERTEHLRPTVFREASECTWSTLLGRLEDSTEIAERRNVQEKEWEGSRCDDGGRDHISRFMAHVQNQTDDFVPEEDDVDDEIESQRSKKGDGEVNTRESSSKTVMKKKDDNIEKLRKEMEKLAKIVSYWPLCSSPSFFQEVEQYDELTEEDTPQFLRHEFEAFMQQKFLAGKDTEYVTKLRVVNSYPLVTGFNSKLVVLVSRLVSVVSSNQIGRSLEKVI